MVYPVTPRVKVGERLEGGPNEVMRDVICEHAQSALVSPGSKGQS